MLTTRSRKNGNSIVVTLPIFNGVKQDPDKKYIVVYGEDDLKVDSLPVRLKDALRYLENIINSENDFSIIQNVA